MTTSQQDPFSRLMNWLSSKGADHPEAPPAVTIPGRSEPNSERLHGRQDDPFSRFMNRISRQD